MKHHFENCFEDKYLVLPWLYGKKTLCMNLNVPLTHGEPKVVYVRFVDFSRNQSLLDLLNL